MSSDEEEEYGTSEDPNFEKDNVSFPDPLSPKFDMNSLVPGPELKSADIAGYLVRTGGVDDDNDPTRPPYEISTHGLSTIGVISRIIRTPDEGLLSLWKGI